MLHRCSNIHQRKGGDHSPLADAVNNGQMISVTGVLWPFPLVLLICGVGWRERRQAIERPTKKFQLGEGWLCASAQSGLSTPIRTATFILVALKYVGQEWDPGKRCFWNCWPKIWDLCRVVRWHAVCIKVWKWKPSYVFKIFWDLKYFEIKP